MEMELSLYDSSAFKDFLKDNPHEADKTGPQIIATSVRNL
jgi:hypothetical protein